MLKIFLASVRIKSVLIIKGAFMCKISKLETFRIHGDNIIECERIVSFLLSGVSVIDVRRGFVSPSCPTIEVVFEYSSKKHHWNIEMFPGFCKGNRNRWTTNIFDVLRCNGSFLDETPDAIVTKVNNKQETILFAVEFCSALQAGNQAWQRSGRAYSVGRTGCPYLYIVDFVKYELDSKTRKRKNLRFPNPAVPYSFINTSKHNCLTVQTYVRSEEFQPQYDKSIKNFDQNIFSESDISSFMLAKMIGNDSSNVERALLDKNMKMVEFLSNNSNTDSQFGISDWTKIHKNDEAIETYCEKTNRFKFNKIIAGKSMHGKVGDFCGLIKRIGVGVASTDLPFGLIPKNKRNIFAKQLKEIYGFCAKDLSKIEKGKGPIVICMIKGFKPGGDDNRPDRGILPLIAMLMNENIEIMTFLYGPILEKNYKLLKKDPYKLADVNGLWKVLLALSNHILLDVPILGKTRAIAEELIDNNDIKNTFLKRKQKIALNLPKISEFPNGYHEDDVDTIIHSVFKHYLGDICFEGMCNPPGGDWSGMSIIYDKNEYRWLSLPRVSDTGKRPDHVLEIVADTKPLLLSIESKERKGDFEPDVGNSLKNYIKYLLGFIPSVEREQKTGWKISNKKLKYSDFDIVSIGAYIESPKDNDKNENCDILLAFIPENAKSLWKVKIQPFTPIGMAVATKLSQIISEKVPKEILSVVD